MVGLGIGLAVKVGTDVDVGTVLGLVVAVTEGAAGEVGDATFVAADVCVGATLVTVDCAV